MCITVRNFLVFFFGQTSIKVGYFVSGVLYCELYCIQIQLILMRIVALWWRSVFAVIQAKFEVPTNSLLRMRV